MLKGIGVSSGIAIGPIKILKTFDPDQLPKELASSPADECAQLKAAILKAVNQLEAIRIKALEHQGQDEAAIFEAHQLMLKDPTFLKKSEKLIQEQNYSAAYAFYSVSEAQVKKFESMEDAYFKERAHDIKDIAKRVIAILTGDDVSASNNQKVIIVAKELTPSQMATFDTNWVLGVVTEIGGETAHSAMIARTREIPAVYGIGKKIEQLQASDQLILDGKSGIILVNPSQSEISEFTLKEQQQRLEQRELLSLIDVKSTTKNGQAINLLANIANLADLEAAIKYKAEGVGLLRTEFLLMGRSAAPAEEEQFIFYKKVVSAFPNHSTTIRTFDMGGDKPIPYLKIPKEENPFLGVRAIRLCLNECNDLFQTQLKAILRASVFGKCQIMIPMITTVEEILAVKENLERAKTELKNRSVDFDPTIKVGIMIETPAAAIMADVLAKNVDFFSIGTNDLIQYVMAADRENAGLKELSHFYNPSVFRMISLVSKAAKCGKIEVSVCGSMARDPLSIIALIACGITKLSMGPSHLLKVKKFIATLDTSRFEEAHNELLKAATKLEYMNSLQNWEKS